MITNNLIINKGAIFLYRLYDIAHEINLKKAKSLLESNTLNSVEIFKLKKDPSKVVIIKEAPLIVSGGEEIIELSLKDKKVFLKDKIEIKIWNYGVLSVSHKINLDENLAWKDLVEIGSILDNNSVIDKISERKRDELNLAILFSLKNPHIHSTFEDYTTYLIEELSVKTKNSTDNSSFILEKVKLPMDVLKSTGIAELLLAEPNKKLSENTHKSFQSNYSQYTKHDLLIMDWNSALVMDFNKEKENKEYKDYIDIIEFSLAQLLELRIYDELLDEKLDELYESIDKKDYKKITEFYSKLSEESGHLYMEFSDFFEKLDNSIKTVGDFYLAKILKSADKKFGFDELKKSMSRKIETLLNISQMYQDKVNSMIDTKRSDTSHRLEIVVIVLIAMEVIPSIYNHSSEIIEKLKNIIMYIF